MIFLAKRYESNSAICRNTSSPYEYMLENAVINGETIPAFNIGGELRLCLPRILRQILGQYHWEQECDLYYVKAFMIMQT